MLRPLHHLPDTRQLRRRATFRISSLPLRPHARRILRQLLHVRQELRLAGDILPQDFGDFNAVFTLVVLQHAAEGTLRGAECAVESMAVGFLVGGVGLLFLAVP